jgi:hypothetical protein
VVHVLVDCPELREIRQQLRDKIGDAFNDIAGMLGGKPQGNREREKGGIINSSVLNAVLARHRVSSCEVYRTCHTRYNKGNDYQ